MAAQFAVQPANRFSGQSQPVKRPKEFTCFSYDDNHELHLDDRSLRWYYPPLLNADLSRGFDQFDKHDDSADEHLDSLLKAIAAHEQKTGVKTDAQVVTWRGMMTKIMAAPFDDRDGFEMNATLYQGCIFIEENHAYKAASRREQEARQNRRPPRANPNQPWFPPDVMSFWGYKFETLATIPTPWGETSRDYIESRDDLRVSNKAEYCSVVRTGVGSTVLCLGGEVDAVWDSKPEKDGAPIRWVELKTSQDILTDRDMKAFERKLLKFWIQSFLLGVPKIVVGFRDRAGRLRRLEEIETTTIPDTIRARGHAAWDGNTCINFAAAFLAWLPTAMCTGDGDGDGVWRIRRRPGAPRIEVFRVEETGHGRILPDDFLNWRIKLALSGTGTA
ncbi:dhp1-interacting protein [Grosmannia clavigera kw1407]|uniref:Decapping nuclease n=1 Tax=Grosmannia clavigera (strain kw1407 / UAMH 11150) TaxID=655863 RepID=F0XRF7_GROCL|nr:dhp1-interacting protein [Grosmannia clavigera kw1407]EFW99933.1 dhp1-interacting protein [Grosmannia clavigera kw1407]